MDKHNKRVVLILISATIVLALLFIAGLTTGSSDIGIDRVIKVLTGKGSSTEVQIIKYIRLPRIIAAILAGATLSVSGAVIQTVIRNPLGSPYTLGLSAASMFGAALAIVSTGALAQQGVAQILSDNPYIISLSAFITGMLCALFVTAFAGWRGASPVTIIMAGIILSALFNSATSLLQYISSDVELSSIIAWMFGDLGKATAENTIIMAAVTIPALGWFVLKSFKINTLNAGDETAASLGIKVKKLRMLSVMLASLCTAVTVAFYGVIAFIGLIIPHVTRKITGSNEISVITGSAIFGAIFLLLCDIAARTITAPIVIPVGIITSFIGAPFFLWLLLRKGKL
ncbi:iron ABC transporter permease [Marinilabiliaceae bacterium ANBcel2]|nr:iron ABC transporter permease [Marinilabiliaceae bacterium ANBcel2]